MIEIQKEYTKDGKVYELQPELVSIPRMCTGCAFDHNHEDDVDDYDCQEAPICYDRNGNYKSYIWVLKL